MALSRSGVAISFFVLALAVTGQGRAQDAIDQRVGEMIEQQKEVFGIPVRRPRCDSGAPGEIVVCAPDQERFRTAPTSESDPTSPQALDDGIPRAPDFSKRCHDGDAGCISVGYAPPPIYIIDLDAIPEPAPGSDADRIAKGEMRMP